MKFWWMVLMACAIVAPVVRADEAEETIGLLLGVLKDTPDPGAQVDMLKGMNSAMEGKRNVKMPAGWAEVYAKLSQSPNEEVRRQAAKLSAAFGDASTLEAMRKALMDGKRPAEERLRALESLLGKNDPGMAGLLQGLLKDPAMREAALKGLAGTDDPKTPAVIFEAYPTFDEASKRAAVNALSFRPAYARALMGAVKGGKVSPKDLTAYTVRQLRTLNDKEIAGWVTQTWGVEKSSNEEKVAEIARFKAMLTPEVLKTGDASAGRALFAKTCGQCHTLYGEGGKVGPDLTGSNRAEIDYLLVNILDPSAVIAKEYMVSLVFMKDGDAFSGIITKEEGDTISLTTESGVQQLERAEVKEIRRSELSMMPEGLLKALSKQEVVNLVTYLRTQSQVALPK